MNRPTRHSPLIAWVLLACVLVNLFACGLAHGQAAALQASGLNGAFCTADGGGDGHAGDPLDAVMNPASPGFSCPMGAALGFALSVLFLLAELLRPPRAPRLPRERRAKAPPRYCWPSANPRASPCFLV
jgi:hypothetical protein